MPPSDIFRRSEGRSLSWPTAVPLLIACIIVAHLAMVLGNIRWNSPTYDEVAHVQAGVSYWKTGHFSKYRVNPPLAKLLQALPVILIHPDRDISNIQEDVGMTLVRVVQTARLAGIFWSLLGAWAIFRWANDLYGSAAGCLGIAFWFFDPNISAMRHWRRPTLQRVRQPLWQLISSSVTSGHLAGPPLCSPDLPLVLPRPLSLPRFPCMAYGRCFT